jgi:hypothetical protein
MTIPWLHQFPIWLTGGLLLVVLFLALEIGFRAGLRQHRRRREELDKAEQSDVTLASVLALLGLMLAFTYAFSLSRYDLRKQANVDEANAIGTAFLRADLAPEPERSELRERLLEYARTRVGTPEAALTAQEIQEAVARSLAAQAKLWPAVRELSGSDVAAPVKVSIAQAVNEVLDAHTTRLKFALDRLPTVVFALLVFIAAFALGVAGYNVALQGYVHRWRMSGFALILGVLMLIITDFDRPLSGFIQVSQYGILSLVEDMESALDK